MTEFEAKVLIQDHGDFVSARFPEGITQTLSWSELDRFEIQANDSGPWGWDVWFVLVGTRDTVSFPQGATGQDDVLERVASVTGKPLTDLIDGMNCTDNCTFVTWEKSTVV